MDKLPDLVELTYIDGELDVDSGEIVLDGDHGSVTLTAEDIKDLVLAYQSRGILIGLPAIDGKY